MVPLCEQEMIAIPPDNESLNAARRNQTRGMLLIEVMFSAAILSVALVSVIGGLASSYEAQVLTRQRTVALESARELIDEIRTARSEGFKVASSLKAFAERFTTEPQLLKLANLREATRTLSVSMPYPGVVSLDVSVEWTDLRGRPAKVILSTALSNYE